MIYKNNKQIYVLFFLEICFKCFKKKTSSLNGHYPSGSFMAAGSLFAGVISWHSRCEPLSSCEPMIYTNSCLIHEYWRDIKFKELSEQAFSVSCRRRKTKCQIWTKYIFYVAFDTHKFHAFIVSLNWVWVPVAICCSCASKLEVMKTWSLCLAAAAGLDRPSRQLTLSSGIKREKGVSSLLIHRNTAHCQLKSLISSTNCTAALCLHTSLVFAVES